MFAFALCRSSRYRSRGKGTQESVKQLYVEKTRIRIHLLQMNLARNGAPRLWRQPSLQLGRQRAFGSMIGGGGTAEQDQLPTGGTRAQELRGHSCKGSCPGAEALLPSPKIEDEMRALPLWKLSNAHSSISLVCFHLHPISDHGP